MAVTMADITKLRKMSGAGMMDCKKALTETNGDIEKAMEIIRKNGQAIAAKRSDRDASEGCVSAKKDGARHVMKTSSQRIYSIHSPQSKLRCGCGNHQSP